MWGNLPCMPVMTHVGGSFSLHRSMEITCLLDHGRRPTYVHGYDDGGHLRQLESEQRPAHVSAGLVELGKEPGRLAASDLLVAADLVPG